MLKRTFDIVAAMAALVLLTPVLALVAIAVRFSSHGPTIFRQERVGRNGRTFVLLKFRTMIACRPESAEPAAGQVAEVDGGAFHAGDTSRITSLGRFLRKTKLDELPQLWNVLKGDMSLVGPRPEVRKWVDAYPERWAIAHRVRPGITDPASIIYRSEEDLLAGVADPEAEYRNVILPRKLDLYGMYVENNTLCGDIVILLKTLRAVIWE